MNAVRLLLQSLRFHSRSHAAVALGVAAGATVLTGALVVGDSMRATLRHIALDRLGRVTHAAVAPHFFHQGLADELNSGERTAAGLIMLRGGVAHASSEAFAGHVQVLGVDSKFWGLGANTGPSAAIAGRAVALNTALAAAIGAKVGDDVLVRIGRPQDVSTDTLLGRRDKTALSLRVTVSAIVPAEGLGAFSLDAGQRAPFNAFLPRELLQKALEKDGRCNALLVAAETADDAELQAEFVQRLAPEDYGLRVRADDRLRTLSVESEAMLLDDAAANAALAAAGDLQWEDERILAYLANRIVIAKRAGDIPYSTIAALEPDSPSLARMKLRGGAAPVALQPGEVFLNSWAADELHAAVDDTVTIDYYVTGDFGALHEESATFRVTGIVELEGAAADPGFTPQYRGVTDAPTMTAWDPPFPVDLKRVRPVDESYWDEHRTTPKAFINFADGVRLWHSPSDPGEATAVRVTVPAEAGDMAAAETEFENELVQRLNPAAMGVALRPVRAEALAAAGGATDFGGLFIGFSFFLIASAALLVALLFGLSIERRAAELGVLLAVGFTPRRLLRLLLAEAAAIAVMGTVVGLIGVRGYAWLMLAGLRSWWSAAVAAPHLVLASSARSYAIGAAASVMLALAAVAWTLRRMTRLAPRILLAGDTAGTARHSHTPGQIAVPLAMVSFVSAGALIVLAATERISAAAGFFGAGAAMLVGGLAAASRMLSRRAVRAHVAAPTLAGLGLGNAPRHPGRSRLTIGLLACACFLIVALQAFRSDVSDAVPDKASGNGGFALYAESAAPIVYDLNSAAGREQAGIAQGNDEAFAGMHAYAFRLRGGEAASCTNLYAAKQPRILGATAEFIARGGFAFAESQAKQPDDAANPWRLLDGQFEDGAIPAIGDEAAVHWQLHSGLGKDLVVRDQGGREVRLRFVALLSGSALQDEIVVAEAAFRRLFPGTGGYGFFLIETPNPEALGALLERGLRGYGLDAEPVAARLQGYLVVQNTYLSTFQTLGGLGLVLGAVGLAAVMLRNVWERRGELALLRALGLSGRAVQSIVLIENAALTVGGLLIGSIAALVAVIPQIHRAGAELPVMAWLGLLAAVLVTGLGIGALAVRSTLKQPLIPALRRE